MQDQLKTRLVELRQELSTGDTLLQQLHNQQRHLERNLLRIGGAVKVLEELLEAEERREIKGTASQDVA